MIAWMTLVAALGAATLGGVFYAFSSFVMPALGRIPPAEGIRAMQRINVDVFHWSFMGLFFAMPLLSIVLALLALSDGAPLEALFAGSGAVLLVGGCFLVTALANVPRNNALARLDAESEDAAPQWRGYLAGWTRWNHLRTAACLLAAGAYITQLAVT